MELNRQRALEKKLARQQQQAGQNAIFLHPINEYQSTPNSDPPTPTRLPPQVGGTTIPLRMNSCPSPPEILRGPTIQARRWRT